MSKLGEVLREERERRGMSQLQLAKACCVDRSMISNYELGKATIPHDVVCRAIRALESNKLRAQACFECAVGGGDHGEEAGRTGNCQAINPRD